MWQSTSGAFVLSPHAADLDGGIGGQHILKGSCRCPHHVHSLNSYAWLEYNSLWNYGRHATTPHTPHQLHRHWLRTTVQPLVFPLKSSCTLRGVGVLVFCVFAFSRCSGMKFRPVRGCHYLPWMPYSALLL